MLRTSAKAIWKRLNHSLLSFQLTNVKVGAQAGQRRWKASSSALISVLLVFLAQAAGVAQGSALASIGSAPRSSSSFTISGRPQRHAQPSGVLWSKSSRMSRRAPRSSSSVVYDTPVARRQPASRRRDLMDQRRSPSASDIRIASVQDKTKCVDVTGTIAL